MIGAPSPQWRARNLGWRDVKNNNTFYNEFLLITNKKY